MKKINSLSIVTALSLCVQGCMSPELIDSAHKVITALPTEVEGCTFLGNVDNNTGYMNVENARFNLQMKVADLGGTHLVEIYAYPVRVTRHFYGVAVSGRAYKCPLGKGPILPSESNVGKGIETNPDLFYRGKPLIVGAPIKETGAASHL